MPDWIGTDGRTTATRYRSMADSEVRGISPSYERLCLGVAEDFDVLARLDELPAPKRQPNLFLAAVRFLGGPVDDWPAFRSFVLAHWTDVSATMLDRRTQTNEPNRCATLLPILAGLPQPLALLEVGASAGLCLYPDRYGYDYVWNGAGVAVGTGTPRLRCTVTGTWTQPAALPDVGWRCGLDLHPLDVTDDEDVRWLESLVWPEQTERFGVLREAVRAARTDPPRIVRGDLTTDLTAVAAKAPGNATLVIFHSAVLAYIDSEGRDAFAAEVRAVAEDRPTVWISNEAPGVVAGTEQPPGGPARFVLARDGVPLGLTGPHGITLEPLP